MPATNPGPIIPQNNYVKNAQSSMGSGSFTLDLAGVKEEHDSIFTLDYCNATSGICDSIGSIPLSEPEFATSFSFVVPPGGYYNGELRLNNDDEVTYDNLCLRQASGQPPNPPPNDPGTLPIPECGTVGNTASFYQLAPYSITEEYSGTAPVILAGLTYNYAIYPLVCTTISIANWFYNALSVFAEKVFGFILFASLALARIIALLEAILDKIPSTTIPLCGILDFIFWLIKIFVELFLQFFVLFAQVIKLIIDIFKDMMFEVRGDSAVQYPFTCSGQGYWMCFALAGILSVQNQVGDWFNIIALIVCSMLTVSLVFWTVNQIRAMMQPGAGGDSDA